MMDHGLCAKRRGFLAALALLVCLSTAARGADNITGSVRNQSRGEPAAGDEVILARLDAGMQEEARAKTDSQGAFTLNVQYSDKPHLVRVFHQGVSYDQQVSAGQALTIQVFDAATYVVGITATIEILRTGTVGNLLHVSDMVEIKNESSPPLTRAGERTFEVYLPASAKIDSVLAAGPEKMSMMISAALVPGQPGHYTVNFPLRPGATKFAFNYDLPYDGHVAFHPKFAFPVQRLAVMISPTMKFSSSSPAFKILATGNRRYQVHAASRVKAGVGPEFEVSGTGALPSLGDQAESQARSQSPAVPDRVISAPGRGALPSLANIDTRLKQTQPPAQSLVLAGLTSVLLATSVLLVWRARKTRSFSAAQTVAPRPRQGDRPQPDWKL